MPCPDETNSFVYRILCFIKCGLLTVPLISTLYGCGSMSVGHHRAMIQSPEISQINSPISAGISTQTHDGVQLVPDDDDGEPTVEYPEVFFKTKAYLLGLQYRAIPWLSLESDFFIGGNLSRIYPIGTIRTKLQFFGPQAMVKTARILMSVHTGVYQEHSPSTSDYTPWFQDSETEGVASIKTKEFGASLGYRHNENFLMFMGFSEFKGMAHVTVDILPQAHRAGWTHSNQFRYGSYASGIGASFRHLKNTFVLRFERTNMRLEKTNYIGPEESINIDWRYNLFGKTNS